MTATVIAAPATRTLAGITVPDTLLIDEAMAFARRACEPYLFNHVMRSWLFAAKLAELEGIAHDGEVLAVGTLLHDITLNKHYAGPRRFEVEGADLARSFAVERGLGPSRAQLIWDSVALNSTPSIGLYKEVEVALCTAGVCLDVIGLKFEAIPAADMANILAEFPRLAMKQKMTQCFCHFAKKHPETSYDNFLRDFGERFIAGYKAPSSVDFVMHAPFDE